MARIEKMMAGLSLGGDNNKHTLNKLPLLRVRPLLARPGTSNQDGVWSGLIYLHVITMSCITSDMIGPLYQ